MIKRVFRFAFESWKKPLIEEWKKNGLWSLFASIFSFVIIYLLIGLQEMRLEAIIAISLSIGTIIMQLFRFLFILMLSPFRIIRDQDKIISSFEKIADRKTIINSLTELFAEGTNIRNRGEAIMHESRIDPWWNEHIVWRNKTKVTMSMLNANMANQWGTLGLFTPRRSFPNALSPLHGKYLQMFDAWLDRLQDDIRKLEED